MAASGDDDGRHDGRGDGRHDGLGDGGAPCPRCGRGNAVLGVPAAYLAAKSTRREETGRGEDQKTTVIEQNAALAAALLPAPSEPEDTGVGCWAATMFLIAVGTFVWGAIAGQWFARAGARHVGTGPDGAARIVVDPPHTVLGWVSGAALVVAVALCALVRLRLSAWRRRVGPGRDAADRVWSAGWYCGRCGTVHFGDGPELTLQEFRVRVWTEGGYGAQALRRRAV
ncbi:hypothetical protein ACFWBI_23645 [Streptomyces sp. NPDC059982]|uniref:hypothetical protein n=1 Tax=unclassified Streptomyces TaxID=2593676 RepID=UPI003678B6A2